MRIQLTHTLWHFPRCFSQVVPLLKQLQEVTEPRLDTMYAALACLLILSQDESFNSFVHEQVLPLP